MRPRLKSLNVLASGTDLVVSLDPKVRVRLADPDGQVLDLLRLLQEGTRTPEELTAEAGTDVRPVLDQLDGLGWLEDASVASPFDAHDTERYFSNLAFF